MPVVKSVPCYSSLAPWKPFRLADILFWLGDCLGLLQLSTMWMFPFKKPRVLCLHIVCLLEELCNTRQFNKHVINPCTLSLFFIDLLWMFICLELVDPNVCEKFMMATQFTKGGSEQKCKLCRKCGIFVIC